MSISSLGTRTPEVDSQRAIQSLYSLLEEAVVPVGVGLHQGYSLSPVLFITFTDINSRHSQAVSSFSVLQIPSLLFAGDLVL